PGRSSVRGWPSAFSSTSPTAAATRSSAHSASPTTAPASTPDPPAGAPCPTAHLCSNGPVASRTARETAGPLTASEAAGASDLVEGHGRGDAGVERLGARRDRDRHDLVALLRDQTGQPLAPGTDDDAQRVPAECQLGQVHLA